MLIGHSDSATDDTGYLKTTIHHNRYDPTAIPARVRAQAGAGVLDPDAALAAAR